MEFIRTYFEAEKSESLIFLALGFLTLSFSIVSLMEWGEPFYKGLVIPLMLIGLVQLVVGGNVYFRTDKQRSQLEQQYLSDQTAFKTNEIERMTVAMKNFALGVFRT